LVDLVKEGPLLGVLALPGVGLDKAQLTHFLVLHQAAFHPAFEVLDLVVSASLGDELVADYAL
jgi:hypothetical protein